jgi:large subunit ribosomal protein L4
MKVDITSLENEVVGQISLDQKIFGLPVRIDILQRVIEWQRAKRRAGTHKTKGVSEVSGTTKKPYKQKGTGNARHGSLRSTQFRGGGVTFGPVVRSHAFDLPKKFRKLGLKTALSAKLAESKLTIVDHINIEQHKTSQLAEVFSKRELNSVLIIDGSVVNKNFALACANLPKINSIACQGANVYDIIRHDRLFITKDGLEGLVERLK